MKKILEIFSVITKQLCMWIYKIVYPHNAHNAHKAQNAHNAQNVQNLSAKPFFLAVSTSFLY